MTEGHHRDGDAPRFLQLYGQAFFAAALRAGAFRAGAFRAIVAFLATAGRAGAFFAATLRTGAFLAATLAGAFLAATLRAGAFLAATFFAGAFFATVFFAGAFLATVFLAGAFFATVFLAVTFFAGAFLATVFFAVTFLAGAFFATVFLAGAFLATVFFATVFFAVTFVAGAFFAATFVAGAFFAAVTFFAGAFLAAVTLRAVVVFAALAFLATVFLAGEAFLAVAFPAAAFVAGTLPPWCAEENHGGFLVVLMMTTLVPYVKHPLRPCVKASRCRFCGNTPKTLAELGFRGTGSLLYGGKEMLTTRAPSCRRTADSLCFRQSVVIGNLSSTAPDEGLKRMLDDLGVAVELPTRVRRVVSLVPSLTEAIAATDATQLIGATDWCTHPPDLDVTRVRGTKNPDVELIRALAPDLVIANAEENRAADLDALRASGVAVWVTAPTTVGQSLDSLGRMLGAVAGEVPNWLDQAREVWSTPYRGPRRRALIPIWRRPWMALGRDTFAGDLLQRLGIDNVLAESPERYPKIDLTALPQYDLVVLPDEPYAFSRDDGPEVFEQPSYLVSGRHLTWYGPSLLTARSLLTEQLR